MAEPLELEESELFDTHDDIEEDELRHAHPKGVQAAVAEDSDDDHSSGLVLPGFEEDDDDTEELGASCASRPDGELMGPTDPRLIESALCAANLGTSAGGSHLGSLKSFEPRSLGRHWSSEGDLGVIAASLPAQSQFQAMAIRAPEPASDANYLGTSMPIRIPLMQRRGLSGSPTMVEGRRVGFVPPHLIDSGAIGTESLKGGVASSLGLSPTAAVKREKLIARNNILRSTGFIEVQQFAAPMGEVIDSVKESMMPGTRPPIGTQRRPTGASSLTALLGTSSG